MFISNIFQFYRSQIGSLDLELYHLGDAVLDVFTFKIQLVNKMFWCKWSNQYLHKKLKNEMLKKN